MALPFMNLSINIEQKYYNLALKQMNTELIYIYIYNTIDKLIG